MIGILESGGGKHENHNNNKTGYRDATHMFFSFVYATEYDKWSDTKWYSTLRDFFCEYFLCCNTYDV